MKPAVADMFDVTTGDLGDQRVIDLLLFHASTARAQTAIGSAHALDLDAVRSPDIRFWTIWDGDQLLGIGALKRLSDQHGEIKSMHTVRSARGRGVGSAMLRHLIATAQKDGFRRLSLETGSWPYFLPARKLYQSHGFRECAPFGDYIPDPNSVFFTRALSN